MLRYAIVHTYKKIEAPFSCVVWWDFLGIKKSKVKAMCVYKHFFELAWLSIHCYIYSFPKSILAILWYYLLVNKFDVQVEQKKQRERAFCVLTVRISIFVWLMLCCCWLETISLTRSIKNSSMWKNIWISFSKWVFFLCAKYSQTVG